MDLKARKLTIIEWLARVQDEITIGKIEDLLKRTRGSSKLKPFSMEEYREMAEQSEEDIKAGRVYSHNEVIGYFKKKK